MNETNTYMLLEGTIDIDEYCEKKNISLKPIINIKIVKPIKHKKQVISVDGVINNILIQHSNSISSELFDLIYNEIYNYNEENPSNYMCSS